MGVVMELSSTDKRDVSVFFSIQRIGSNKIKILKEWYDSNHITLPKLIPLSNIYSSGYNEKYFYQMVHGDQRFSDQN
jgi:hypothetical protein